MIERARRAVREDHTSREYRWAGTATKTSNTDCQYLLVKTSTEVYQTECMLEIWKAFATLA